MDVKEEIYRTVETIVERYVADQKKTEQVSGIVLNSLNDKYTVLVNGSKYVIKDGVGISPAPNTPVWICVPNNNWNQAYICAGKANTQGGTGNVKDVYQNNASVLGEDHIARIRCATPEDIQQLQANFQDGVDAIGNACIRKGSTPASFSLEDTVAAIDAIQTGGNYMTKEIREDGTYRASDDGVDAYDIVVVSKDVGQPHTVMFYDINSNIIKTDANIPYHGNASCTTLDGTTYNGQYFKGWNPSPLNIVRDTYCYPIYGDYTIDSEEIEDSWETICSKNGADYPLGSYKTISINVPAYGVPIVLNRVNSGGTWLTDGPYYTTPPAYAQDITSNAANFTVQMAKVAEGEDGSTSTWISKTSIDLSANGASIDKNSSQNVMTFCYGTLRNATVPNPFYGEAIYTDWGDCGMRKWFNEYFSLHLPECIQDTLKSVEKRYTTTDILPKNYNNSIVGTQIEKSCLDKVWIPSMKELHTFFSSCSNYSSYSSCEETRGIDYASVLNYPGGKFMTRTLYTGDRYPNPLFINNNSSITSIDQGCGRAIFGFCL